MLIPKSVLLIFLIFILGFKPKLKSSSSLGNIIVNFSLKSTDNKLVALDSFKNARGFIIIFTCNHCPFAKLYTQRFNELFQKYDSLGVHLLAINSMDTAMYEEEGFANMQDRAKIEKYQFTYLYDANQKVAKMFKAAHTPQAYVLWKTDSAWKVKYCGAIDNNGEQPELATSFLGKATDELLNDKTVSKPETESFGCRIFYRD